MKRTPIKRGTTPLKTRTRLTARSTLKASKGLRRTPPKALTRDEAAARREFRAKTMQRTGGKCIVTGRRAQEAHHVVPKELLPDSLRWDPENGVALTQEVHANHTSGYRRLPRDVIPKLTLEWAKRHGFWHVIENEYPTRKDQ